jgi:hypothetical protein
VKGGLFTNKGLIAPPVEPQQATASAPWPPAIYINFRKRLLWPLPAALPDLICLRQRFGAADLVEDREPERGESVFRSIGDPPPRKLHLKVETVCVGQ